MFLKNLVELTARIREKELSFLKIDVERDEKARKEKPV